MDSVVVRDPEIMSGEPTFRGTRVLVRTLFDYLEAGHSLYGKPGDSIAGAERAGFQVLITVDQNLPYQQTVAKGSVGDLIVLMPELLL